MESWPDLNVMPQREWNVITWIVITMADGKLAMKQRGHWRLALSCALGLFSGLVSAQETTPPADAASPTTSRVVVPEDAQANESKPVEAKPVTTARPPEAVRPEAGSRSPLDALPTAVRYLPNKLGELVPVLANATWESYVEFITNPPSMSREAAPAAAVSSIELTGEADDERAILTARVIVRLRSANEYVRVPLQLNEAVLTKWEYTGDGQQIPGDKDRDRGYVWWFRGAGPHQLDLTLSVPIRKQLPTRRLLLSLPVSPVAKLKLTVPHSGATAKAGDQTPLEIKAIEGGKTQFEAFGMGSRIDGLSPRVELGWQPAPTASRTESSLESNTTILAQVDTDAVLLDVQQRVQALQGTFDSFAVLLPFGAEVLTLEGDDSPKQRPDPNTPHRVIVSLGKATVGPVRLHWTVRLPAVERRRLKLDGFVVEGARKQSGEIGLAPHDGLRLSSNSKSKDANILRIDAGSLRTAAGTAPVTLAYRFLSQPFNLNVGVEPIEAYYVVEPKLYVTAAVHQLNLDAVLQYQVYRDSLSEVTIQWPDWKARGWVIDGIDPPGLVEAPSLDEDRNEIRLRLVKRQNAAFQIRLRARRPLKGPDDAVLALPRALASSSPSVSLVVANAENVETELTALGETVLRPMPATTVELATLPESLRGLKWSGYRIDTDEQAVSMRIVPQQRRLRMESASEAAWQNDRVQIVQRIACDVVYERLTQLKLKVPRELSAERVRFFTEREVELTADWMEDAADTQMRLVRLTLPEPKIGRFDIQARFFVRVSDALAADVEGTVAIPIVQSGEEPFSQTRFSLARTDWFEAAAEAVAWKPLPLRPEAWLWSMDGSQPEFVLRVTRSRGSANGTARVSKGLITAVISGAGMGQIRAQFRIATRSASLNLTLPQHAELTQVFWDRTPLTPGSDIVEVPASTRKFTLRLPESSRALEANRPLEKGGVDSLNRLADSRVNERPVGDHLLTIDYQLPCLSPGGGVDHVELFSPQLPQSSWMAEVVWQAVLPSDRHVFTYPSSATPMFRWQRQGLFWHRLSDPVPSQLRQRIGADSGPPSLAAADIDSPELAGNLYAFSQFGAPRALSFRVMSRPMIVLFGAGLSLLAGFAMLRIPALRHVLTVLCAGLLLATIGLWHAAPLELLLQPMIAGLIFPTVAVLIESWFRHRDIGTVLTLPSPQALSAIHGSSFEELPPGATGSSPTLMRFPPHDSRDGVRAESGSGVS